MPLDQAEEENINEIDFKNIIWKCEQVAKWHLNTHTHDIISLS